MRDTKNKISINNPKLGEVRLPIESFDAPEAGKVMSVRFSPRRDSNGNVIQDSVGKIILEVANFKMLQAVIKNGGSESDLATITLEYVTDEAILKGYKAEDLLGKILDLRQAEVGLKWVQRGTSGSWGGFKIICTTLKFLQLPPKKVNE